MKDQNMLNQTFSESIAKLQLPEVDVVNVMMKVAKNHGSKAFAYHTSEDIEGEAYLIMIQLLPKFDVDRGTTTDVLKSLEHWLNRSVGNRLRNFYRNNYRVPQKHKNVIDLFSLDITKGFLGDSIVQDNMDVLNLFMSDLDICELDILESLLNGEKITSYYKTKFTKRCQEWVQQNT